MERAESAVPWAGREGAKAREETGVHIKRGLRGRQPGTGGSSQPQTRGVCGAHGTASLCNQKSRAGVQMTKDGHPRGGHSGSREDELGRERRRPQARFPHGPWAARAGPLHVSWRAAWRRRRTRRPPCRLARALRAHAHTGPAPGGLVPAQGRLQLLLLLGQLHLELGDLRLQFCDLLVQVAGLPIQLPLELLQLLPALLLLLQPHCAKARALQGWTLPKKPLEDEPSCSGTSHTHTEEPSHPHHALVEGKSALVPSIF